MVQALSQVTQEMEELRAKKKYEEHPSQVPTLPPIDHKKQLKKYGIDTDNLSRQQVHDCLQTLAQLAKLQKKKLLTRSDLTTLAIQENIRLHNSPVQKRNFDTIALFSHESGKTLKDYYYPASSPKTRKTDPLNNGYLQSIKRKKKKPIIARSLEHQNSGSISQSLHDYYPAMPSTKI